MFESISLQRRVSCELAFLVAQLRGSWNEELFRVLEGFPDLSHDDEVDACSGALEMLNPQMASWGLYELIRRQLQAAEERRKPQPSKTVFARGSMEWQAEQEKARLTAAPAPVPHTPPDIE